MRLAVCSDSHGSYAALEKIVLARPDADLFVHLGDGEKELEELSWAFPEKEFVFVRGNCDFTSTAKAMDLLTLGGVRVMMTHGDAYAVKYGLERLKREAVGLRARIVLFGHTHTPLYEQTEGLHLFNPGSAARPRAGAPTYGVVDILPGDIRASILEVG